MPVPRPIAPQERRHSSRLGSRLLNFVRMISRTGCSAVIRISAMPKSPITTGTMPRPS